MSWRDVLEAIPITFLPSTGGGNAALGLIASQHAERLPSSDAAGLGAASGYPCCPDCGMCDPCDEHCPNYVETAFPRGFEPDKFFSEIEPVPAFISRRTTAEEIEELLELARAEEWPAPPRRMVG